MPDDRLPCGCRRSGFMCPAHHPGFWGDAIASDPGAIIALALFAANIAVWAAILG